MRSCSYIVGLGNPGATYRQTRHNLGFMVVEQLAAACGASWTRMGNYRVARGRWLGEPVVLVEPLTYMNRSGGAIRALQARESVEAEDLLVVVDDIALPLGHLRLRRRGSDGGHNGLRSIIEAIGTRDFARLRLGVGPVPAREDPADFVVSPFEPRERPVVERLIDRARGCIEEIRVGGFDEAMTRFNGPDTVGQID